jgi:hypothetical protein
MICLVQMIWRVGKRAQTLTRLGSLPLLVKNYVMPHDAPPTGEVCEPRQRLRVAGVTHSNKPLLSTLSTQMRIGGVESKWFQVI